MAKFKTLEDVKSAFLDGSGGTQSIREHRGVRFDDIEKYSSIVERLLDTDYNVHGIGYSISEICEAISSYITNYADGHYGRMSDKAGIKISEALLAESHESVNESLGNTTVGQSPFPVPSVNFTQYIYSKSMAPYFAHVFDLEGNRGLVYFQRFTAKNSQGNVTKGDLLGSPRELGVQTLGFAGGMNPEPETLGNLEVGTQEYDLVLSQKPTPGTLIVQVEGLDGYFKDFANARNIDGEVQLYAIEGNPGNCTVNYETKEVKLELAAAPTTAGLKITAVYVRELQTVENAAAIAEVEMTIDSEQLVAEDFSVKLDTNIQQERLSQAIFGKDWNMMAEKGMAALYNKEVANKIMTEIKQEIIAESKFTHDITKGISAGGNNNLFNVVFMSTVIEKLCALIREASGCAVNRLAAIGIATDLIPVIASLEGFKKVKDAGNSQGGAQLVGDFKGTPVVAFFNSILGSGEMVAIHKSQEDSFLAPYVFGEFIKPVMRTVYDNNNLSTNRMQLIASAAGKVVAKRLAAQMTVTGLAELL